MQKYSRIRTLILIHVVYPHIRREVAGTSYLLASASFLNSNELTEQNH